LEFPDVVREVVLLADVRIALALIAIHDETPTLLRVRKLRADGRRDRRKLRAHVRDLVAHAARRVDHERDVELRFRAANREARMRGIALLLRNVHEARKLRLIDEILLEEIVVAIVVPRARRERAGRPAAA